MAGSVSLTSIGRTTAAWRLIEATMALITESYAGPEIRLLTDALAVLPVGEVATYDQLSAIIGAPIQARRWLLLRALRRANAEYGVVTVNLRKVGYRRLANAEADRLCHRGRKRIRVIARTSSQMLANNMRFANDLTDQDRQRNYAELSMLGLVEHLARDSAVKKITAPADRPVPLTQVMRQTLVNFGVDLPAPSGG